METNRSDSLRRYITTSGGIPFRKVYGKLVFPQKEIDLWIDAQLNPEINQTLKGKVRSKINKNINLIKLNHGKFQEHGRN